MTKYRKTQEGINSQANAIQLDISRRHANDKTELNHTILRVMFFILYFLWQSLVNTFLWWSVSPASFLCHTGTDHGWDTGSSYAHTDSGKDRQTVHS